MTKRILAAIAATLTLAPGAARAATITSLSAMVPLASGSYSQNIDFAQFDPMAGTLTGVSVILFTRYDADVSGTYPLGTSATYRVNYNGSATLEGAGGGISLSQTFGDDRQVIGCQSFCLDPGQTFGSIGVSGADVVQLSQALGVGDNLSPFIGGGLLSLNFTGFSKFGGSGVDLDPSSYATVGGRVRLTYMYDPGAPAVSGVPEPASWALMTLGFGLAGAGMRLKRRGLPASAATITFEA